MGGRASKDPSPSPFLEGGEWNFTEFLGDKVAQKLQKNSTFFQGWGGVAYC